MSTPALNVVIWLSVKPIIKLALPAGAGFCLTRSGLFPVAGSRAASQIILNVTLPALLFSKIVPSLNSSNIGALGPIILVALVYQGLSLIFGAIIRTIFPTPRNFRWGLLAAAGWSNWGDLPTSVVATVTLSAPFNGTEDSNLAIAYVAIFILVFYITFFPLRGTKLIERDYTHPPPELDEEVATSVANGRWWDIKNTSMRVRGLSSVLKRRIGRESREDAAETSPEEHDRKAEPSGQETPQPLGFSELHRVRTSLQPGFSDLRRVATSRSAGAVSMRDAAGAAAAASFEDTGELSRKYSIGREQKDRAAEERRRLQTIVGSRAGSVFDDSDEITHVGSHIAVESASAAGKKESESTHSSQKGSQSTSLPRRIALGAWDFVSSLFTPPTIALISGLVIALVTKLKVLFVAVTDGTFHPTAPDGDPPLAIILDTMSFLGAASVPLGLLVLGAALARMRLPRPISRLPLASIFGLAICKLVLLPVIGFLFVHALTFHTSMVPPSNKVLRFVLIYFSCVPTATTQVALTQIYAPEDGESNSDVLASYLIVQYAIFVISSVVLTAYTLSSF